MNERIRKLAQQAGIKITPMILDGVEYEYEDVDMDGSEDLEKFAELIVRECLHIVDDEGAGEGGYIRAMIRIQEEFGVEA